MTVTTEHSLTTAVAPGGTDTFLFDFQTLDIGDIAAYANGILDAGASVTLNANQAVSPGGSVQYSAVQAIGTAISIERDMDLQQLTNWPAGGNFPSDSHETAADKVTMMAQQAVATAEGLFSSAGVVTLSSDQVISGAKTFTADVTINKAAPALVIQCADEATEDSILGFYDESVGLRGIVYRPAGLNLLLLDARTALGVVGARLDITEAGKVNVHTGDLQLAGVDLFSTIMGGLNTKVIDIGDWDMDATPSVTVLHGVTYTKIRNMSALIVDDAGTNITNINYDTGSGAAAGSMSIASADTTSITLNRFAGELFDSINYDTTPYNRGWITIEYVD